MKKYFLLISLLLVCYCLKTSAQSTTTLHVGDPAPVFKPFRWIRGTPVSKFEKGQVYVVEFGATWCKPCIAMIPHLSSMAEKYKGKATVISAFVMELNEEPLTVKEPGYVTRVEAFIDKRSDAIKYSVAVDDPAKTIEQSWLGAAGKQGVPHTFIVDKAGLISAMTQGKDNIEKAIEIALAKDYDINKQVVAQKLEETTKTTWSDYKLLLIDGNGGRPEDFMFRSLITEFKMDFRASIPDYLSSHNDEPEGTERRKLKGVIQAPGAGLKHLYRLAYADTLWPYFPLRSRATGEWTDTVAYPYAKNAYGKYWYDLILEVKDKNPFLWVWNSPANRFNYSLKVPEERSSASLMQQIMRSDLKNYFGYEVSVEERMMPYWKIVLVPGAEFRLKTATPDHPFKRTINYDIPMVPRSVYTNARIGHIIEQLQLMYGFGIFDQGKLPKEEVAPFIDETNFKGEFDIILEPGFIGGFESTRQFLKEFGIDIVKSVRMTKVIVIRDPE